MRKRQRMRSLSPKGSRGEVLFITTRWQCSQMRRSKAMTPWNRIIMNLSDC